MLRALRFAPRTWLTILLAAAVFLAVVRFVTSWQDVHRYGGTDLRCRVVGARAMLAGLNPYRLPPNAQLPESLRDVDRPPQPTLSRITYPPTLLAAYGVFASLPYLQQRLIWFSLEWGALLVSILTLATCIPSKDARLAFVAMSLIYVAASPGWRLHVERGQYYVFVLLLMAVAARLSVARKPSQGLAGVCVGLAVALRPSLALVLILLWVLRWRRTAIVGVMTAGVCVLLTLPFAGIPVWRDYSTLVRRWQASVLFHENVTPPPQKNAYLEGVDFSEYLDPNQSANLTSIRIMDKLRREFLAQVPGRVWIVVNSALALTAIVVPGLFLWRRRHRLTGAGILVGSLMIGFFSEYFIPIRWGYADVLLILPLALLLPYLARRPYFLIAAGAAMVTGEFAVHGVASAIVISLAWWTMLLVGYRQALLAEGATAAATSRLTIGATRHEYSDSLGLAQKVTEP